MFRLKKKKKKKPGKYKQHTQINGMLNQSPSSIYFVKHCIWFTSDGIKGHIDRESNHSAKHFLASGLSAWLKQQGS